MNSDLELASSHKSKNKPKTRGYARKTPKTNPTNECKGEREEKQT